MTDIDLVYSFLKDLRNTTFLISDTEAIPLVLNFIKAVRVSESITLEADDKTQILENIKANLKADYTKLSREQLIFKLSTIQILIGD